MFEVGKETLIERLRIENLEHLDSVGFQKFCAIDEIMDWFEDLEDDVFVFRLPRDFPRELTST